MEVTIRPIQTGDGKGLNELRRMPGVYENTLGIPSERVKRNEDWIVNMDANTHVFVAVVSDSPGNEKIIGLSSLTVGANPRRRHSGSIGIMVHRDYQKKGVGTKLMAALIDVADNWLMLVRVELTVFADNKTAIELYKKFGFETEGILKMASIRNGKYVDEFTMGRIRADKIYGTY